MSEPVTAAAALALAAEDDDDEEDEAAAASEATGRCLRLPALDITSTTDTNHSWAIVFAGEASV